jgi:hypothetical protein
VFADGKMDALKSQTVKIVLGALEITHIVWMKAVEFLKLIMQELLAKVFEQQRLFWELYV